VASNIGELCRRNVVSIRESEDLVAAARLMREEHVGYVVVVEPQMLDQSLRPVGVITDRDIVIAVVAKEVDPRTLRVGDVMTRQPIVATEDSAIGAALQQMRRVGVRRLPVIGRCGNLVGVVSIDDLVGTIADELANVAGTIHNEQRIEGALRP
jgi:CBS domain-containing protein